MELSVLNKEGKETGRKVVLNDEIFGIEPSDHAIYLDVKQYMANQRQGTHKSKELKSKKVPVARVQAASNHPLFVVVVPCLDLVLAIMSLN